MLNNYIEKVYEHFYNCFYWKLVFIFQYIEMADINNVKHTTSSTPES